MAAIGLWQRGKRPFIRARVPAQWVAHHRGAALIHQGKKLPRVNSPRGEITAATVNLFPRCMVPAFDGASLSSDSKDALWAKFYMGAPRRLRRSVERYSIVKRAQRALAKPLGINPKTVAKWRKRASASDLPTGPKEPRSTVLSVEEEAVVVAFRRHTLLPLDDCLYALQPTIPHLTRSSLHRCLKRHGISRLPQVRGEASPKRKFKAYPIGYFHIDIAGGSNRAGQAISHRRDRPDLQIRLRRTA